MNGERGRRTPAFVAALIAGAIILAAVAGCAGSNSPYVLSSWFDLGKPNLTSFLGVRFGSSLDRVREELPDGDFETSPYGANAWRVENIEAGGVRYRKVVFEFTDNMGMQLAIAEFAPEAGATVLAQLKRALGEPTALRPGAGTPGSERYTPNPALRPLLPLSRKSITPHAITFELWGANIGQMRDRMATS